MPRTFLPVPIITTQDASAATLAAQLNTAELLSDESDPARWTLHLLTLTSTRQLSRTMACAVQRYLIHAIALPNKSDQWAILAVTASLGQIQTTDLKLDCLRWLIRHMRHLHHVVIGRVITTTAALRAAVDARKIQLSYQCTGSNVAYLGLLDRTYDSLAPHLRPTG